MGNFAQHSIYGYATSWLGPNFGFAKTSYMLEPLYKMLDGGKRNEKIHLNK